MCENNKLQREVRKLEWRLNQSEITIRKLGGEIADLKSEKVILKNEIKKRDDEIAKLKRALGW